jgi:release factor glutamine methyltransferase
VTRSRNAAGTPAQSDAAALLKSVRGTIPRADAEYLLMHVLKVPRHQLYLGQAIPARAASRFRQLVTGALDGEPVHYLTGCAPFLDFEVRVNRRVLIPRPETEELVARTTARLRSSLPQPFNRKLLAVDFGTGSGCIAIAIARAFPKAQIMAVDASRPALNVAQQNVARLGVDARVRLGVASNLADPALSGLRGRLDLLMANPPYIPTPRLARLAPPVRREPQLALDGGPKGANIVAMLLTQGPSLLRPGGLLALEIDATHERVVRCLSPRAQVERDLAGRIRYAFLTK